MKFKNAEQVWITNELPKLENLKPYYGAIKKFNTPREYIENYFIKGRPGTYTRDGIKHCKASANRSFTDIYYLVKAKFKDVTFEEVCYIILKLATNGYNERKSGLRYYWLEEHINHIDFINILYCPHVSKIVMNTTIYTKPSIFDIGQKLFIKKRKYYSLNIDKYDYMMNYTGIDGLKLSDVVSAANKYIKQNG